MSEKNEDQLSDEEKVALETKAALDAEIAFEAGFKDEQFQITPEPTGDPNAEQQQQQQQTPAATIKPGQETKIPTKEPEVDEWEGISDTLKKRFKDMEAGLAKANQVANAASGQARKLQNQVANQKTEPPRPTSEQILAAMTDKTKREALREDWGTLAEAMDEADLRVATAVGAEMDKFRSEMTSQFSETQSDYNIKRNLDNSHPGWETTINTDSFKDFIYEGGPTVVERTDYENTLSYARSLHNNSPVEAKTLFGQANELYASLLAKYPTWAETKGKLYNAPDGGSAIKLLDMHKLTTKPNETAEQEQQRIAELAEKAALLNKNKQLLAANIAPTSGRNTPPIVASPDQEAEAEKAFADGFNS
jgi:hypothetical protein